MMRAFLAVAAALMSLGAARAQSITGGAPGYVGTFGCASATGTSATQVIAAPAAGLRIYITNVQAYNTGASASSITIQTDTAGSPATLTGTINPAGAGSNPASFLPGMLYGGVAKNVGFTAGTASTTQTVCITGYVAP